MLVTPIELSIPLPSWLARLCLQASLLKGIGHKYVRREPTGDAKRPWRYYYNLTGRHGRFDPERIEVGAKYKIADGHLHVSKVDGDQLHVVHDETGESAVISRAHLADVLESHHAEEIDRHAERRAKRKERSVETARERALKLPRSNEAVAAAIERELKHDFGAIDIHDQRVRDTLAEYLPKLTLARLTKQPDGFRQSVTALVEHAGKRRTIRTWADLAAAKVSGSTETVFGILHAIGREIDDKKLQSARPPEATSREMDRQLELEHYARESEEMAKAGFEHIPAWLGAIIGGGSLEKGAGHKYLRRVPTGNPKRPWRYYYRVTGGKTLGHEDEMVAGAAFKVRDAEKEGHFHIVSTDDKTVTIRHDESGRTATLTKIAFRALLHNEHAEAIKTAQSKLKQDLTDVAQYGTPKQQERVQARAQAAEGLGEKLYVPIEAKRDTEADRGGAGVLGAERRGPGGGGRADEASSGGAKVKEPTEKEAVIEAHDPGPAESAPGPSSFTQQKSPAIQLHADLLPVITAKLPEEVRRFKNPQGSITELYSHQVEGAERILSAWQQSDGMVLSDDAGLGKTNTALAAIVAHGGKRNLIVVPTSGKANLIKQWIDSGKLYGVEIKRGAQAEGTCIVSYEELYEAQKVEREGGGKAKTVKSLAKGLEGAWDTVTMDESHTCAQGGFSGKGDPSAANTFGRKIQEQAKKALYLSATPFTNIADMSYLTKLGLFGPSADEFKQWAVESGASEDGGKIKNPRSPLPMAAIAATLHVDGKTLKRVTSLEGVTSQFGEVQKTKLSEGAHRTFKAAEGLIEDAINRGIVAESIGKAFYTSWARQYWETLKVPQAVELGKQALADGKQVAFYTSFKSANHAHLRALAGIAIRKAERMMDSNKPGADREAQKLIAWATATVAEIDALPPVVSVVKELAAAFGGAAKVAEIHGDTSKDPSKEQEAYQRGDKKVVVATMARGGTGISLHDTKGDAPRVQINLSLPWSGREFVQVAGRSHRLGSKSNTTMHWLVGADPVEQHNAATVAHRLKSMGSLTQGDPEATLDATTLSAWSAASNHVADIDDDPEAIVRVLTKAADGTEPADGEEADLASAARDYFREFGEARRGGRDVLKEQYTERLKAEASRRRLEARRVAEQIKQRMPGDGWRFHFDDAAQRAHVDVAGFREHKKVLNKVAGERSSRHPEAGWGWSVPYAKMPLLASSFGAETIKIDMREIAAKEAAEAKTAAEQTAAFLTKEQAPDQKLLAGAREALRGKRVFVTPAPASRPGWFLLEGQTFDQKESIKSAGGRFNLPWAPRMWAIHGEGLAKLAGVTLTKSMAAAGMLTRIPVWLAKAMLGLEKGAGHKYIRRVPTGDPKRPFRYYYRVTGGEGLGHDTEIKEGAKFRVKDADKEGHFEVTKIVGDQVTIRHDETGKEATIHRQALRTMLHREHAEAITSAREKARQNVSDAMKYGTAKQRIRTYAQHKKVESAFGEKKPELTVPTKAAAPAKKPGPALEISKPVTSQNIVVPMAAAPDEKPIAPKESKKGSRREHVEVGEHVAGSRADLAKMQIREVKDLDGLTSAERFKVVQKDKVLGEIDPVQERADGAGPGAVSLKKWIYRAVTARPADSDEARQRYIEGCALLGKTLAQCKTAQNVIDAMRDLRGLASFNSTPDPERKFETREEAEAESRRTRGGGTWGIGRNKDRTWSPMIDALPSAEHDRMRQQLKALGDRLDALVSARGPYGGKSTAYQTAMHEAVKLDGEGWKETAIGEPAAEEKSKAEKNRRWRRSVSDLPERTGGKRTVEKADAGALAEDFGFKNVQFGNWIADKDAEYHVLQAHNALLDLADVLAIDPKQVSMNGRLAIGFGARGSGAAAAHYEPDKKIINLTKFAGGGTIAHEWGHFLDNIVYELHGPPKGTRGSAAFASAEAGAGLPGDLKGAYDGVLDAIFGGGTMQRRRADALYNEIRKVTFSERRTPEYEAKVAEYKRLAKEAAGAKATRYTRDAETMGKYWASTEELFARAFEAYVQDKLEDNGRRSSYLVDGTRAPYETGKKTKATTREQSEAARNNPEMRQLDEELGHLRDVYNSARRMGVSTETQNAAADRYNAKLAEYRKKLEEINGGDEAQPYPQGEERTRINQALDTLMGALRKGKHLEKALAMLDLKDAMKKAANPWAVCHASTGPAKDDKFERCVKKVKEKQGMKKGTFSNNEGDETAQEADVDNAAGAYEKVPDLEKAGAGSRGGHVIGHTKSGKAVYENHAHPAHAGFSAGEHREAANLHDAAAQKLLSQKQSSKDMVSRMSHHAKIEEHQVHSYKHDEAASHLEKGTKDTKMTKSTKTDPLRQWLKKARGVDEPIMVGSPPAIHEGGGTPVGPHSDADGGDLLGSPKPSRIEKGTKPVDTGAPKVGATDIRAEGKELEDIAPAGENLEDKLKKGRRAETALVSIGQTEGNELAKALLSEHNRWNEVRRDVQDTFKAPERTLNENPVQQVIEYPRQAVTDLHLPNGIVIR